jgi:hypothetical protein
MVAKLNIEQGSYVYFTMPGTITALQLMTFSFCLVIKYFVPLYIIFNRENLVADYNLSLISI